MRSILVMLFVFAVVSPCVKAEEAANIEKNQTAAAALCMAFCEAQEIYRRTDYNKNGVLEYAQAMQGENSLLETAAGKADLALIDKDFAAAAIEELGAEKAKAKAGYFFRILKAQGKNAAGGARNYVNDAKAMTLGYALVAFPAEYGKTGKLTYIISNNGTTFQKDLGEDTETTATEMTEFNPDETWTEKK